MKASKVIIKIIIIMSLLALALGAIVVHSASASNQIPIIVTVPNSLTGTSLMYIFPLPLNSNISPANYYVINQQGYYIYSYLFSQSPPLLVLYSNPIQNTTYYAIYGISVSSSSQYVTTSVFSSYFQFYYINTSIMNVSKASASGGVLSIANGGWFTYTNTAVRYTPNSVLYLYNFLPPLGFSLPSFLVTYSLPPGSLILFHLFGTTSPISVPASYAMPLNKNYLITNNVTIGNMKVVGNQITFSNYATYTIPSAVRDILYFNGSGIYANNQFIPSYVVFNQNTNISGTYYASFYSLNFLSNGYVGVPNLIADPTFINGSNFVIFGSNGTTYKVPVKGNIYLSQHPYLYILPHYYNSSKYIYVDFIPQGSTISVTYLNGSVVNFYANGNVINNIGELKLTTIAIPYGSGISSISFNLPSSSQYTYTALVGFYDYLHHFWVNVTNGRVSFAINNNVYATFGSATFPMTVGIGSEQIGNTTYLLAFVYSQAGFYTYILPSPVPVYNSVPYVTYNTPSGNPLLLSEVGVTLANGLYTQITHTVQYTVGNPQPANSVVLNALTHPGYTIINNNGNIISTTEQGVSSPLTVIGFSGYQAIVTYSNGQQVFSITSGNYSINLPVNTPVLISIQPTTRTIQITTGSSIQSTPYYTYNYNYSTTHYKANVTVVSPLASVKALQPTIKLSNTDIIVLSMYYGLGAMLISLLLKSNVYWYPLFMWSLISIAFSVILGQYTVIIYGIFMLFIAYEFKKIGK